MVGDERVRFCDQCSLHVYNLSDMTRREAESLVTNTEGRLCIRFYRRTDGTILTRNCPVGLSALKRQVSRIAGATLSAVLGFFAGVGLDLGFQRPETPRVMGVMALPVSRLSEEVEAPAPVYPTRPPVQRRAQVGEAVVGKKAWREYDKDVSVGSVRRHPKRPR
jgi:hypothetical protein